MIRSVTGGEHRVAFVITSLSAGGAERVVSILANFWVAAGSEVMVITFESEKLDFYELDARVLRCSVNLTGISRSPFLGALANLRRIYALRKVLRRYRASVAISFMTKNNVLLALSTVGLRGLLTIGSERSNPARLEVGPLWSLLRKYSYQLLDSIIVLGDGPLSWINRNIPNSNVYVIPNPVQWPLNTQKPVISVQQGFKSKKILLAVGRLSPEKQFGLLVRVFSQLQAHSGISDWVLVIIGEGPEKSKLKDAAENYGVADKVCLPGNVGNLGDWYNCAQLLALTSQYEGFPNVLLEAMSHGVPVVSFDCDFGPRDIVRNCIDGLLVPPNNESELEAALRRLMTDETQRMSYSRRAREVKDRFSVGNIAGRWEAHIEYLRMLKWR